MNASGFRCLTGKFISDQVTFTNILTDVLTDKMIMIMMIMIINNTKKTYLKKSSIKPFAFIYDHIR